MADDQWRKRALQASRDNEVLTEAVRFWMWLALMSLFAQAVCALSMLTGAL